MKKFAYKILSLVCAGAVSFAAMSGFGASAAAETKRFLDPMEDSSFPKAYSVKTILPDNYDVTEAQVMANGGVFGPNSDKRALAAFKTNKTMKLFKEVYGDGYTRTQTLMKNYIACELELIYEFKNGFKDFEFMGVAGAGNWAGAWGMEENPPLEISYSSSATGGWTVLKYKDMREMPAAEGSTYCYFRGKSIPTSARYLRIRFLNGADYDGASNMWVPRYKNWTCALGYLLVDEYTAPQSGGNTSSTPSSGKTNGGTASKNNSQSGVTSSGSGENASNASEITSSTDETVSDSAVNDNKSTEVSKNGEAEVSTETVTKIDWPRTVIMFVCELAVVGAVCALLIILYRKKVKKL